MYKMYNTQWDDEETDDDKNSLASSFWSDGERQGDEEVEMEQVIGEKDSKPASNAEDSVQEASEEKEPELNNEDNQDRSDDGNNDKNEDEDDENEDEDDEESEDEDDENEDDNDDENEDDENEDDIDENEVDDMKNEDEDNEDEFVVYDENVDEENNDDDAENGDDNVEDEDNENEDDLDKNENVVEENEDDNENEGYLDKNESGVHDRNKEDNNKNKDNQNENEEDENENEDEENKDDDNDNENYESEEDDEDKSCYSSSDSPAPSLMTSGYGTYRPEEQDGGDYRDDHTITEFDQDSRADLSEMRDDEDVDHSFYSFGGFDVEPAEFDCSETLSSSFLADTEPEAGVDFGRDVGLHEGMNPTDMTSEDKEQTYEEKLEEDLHAVCENEVINSMLDEQQHEAAEMKDTFVLDEKQLEGESVNAEENERLEKAAQDLQTENKMKKEDKVESGESDESSCNKDIKFIDSKLDFSKMTFDKMCEDWEGNLRATKDVDSHLEERLAELNLLTSARTDFECEDATSHSTTESSGTGEISMSAFESYIRGMTQDQCDSYIRPKPKSFIRPVMSQQAVKKTDPVAKYFRYKQFWEMFKLPGERDRRALRLEIKERLTYQPPPPKPRRVYVPNNYIVPTEKKRSALRWEIRNDLANGLMPCKYSY